MSHCHMYGEEHLEGNNVVEGRGGLSVRCPCTYQGHDIIGQVPRKITIDEARQASQGRA